MTTQTDPSDGGAAFPYEQGHTAEGTRNQTFDPGMSLRDYFAAKAMQGYCAREDSIEIEMDAIVSDAYAIADAMLAARKESTP